MVLIPFIITFIPTFFFVPLSLLFDEPSKHHCYLFMVDISDRYLYYRYYFIFGPACLALYWMTILLIKQSSLAVAACVNAYIFKV
jgi:hypothetical protein